MNKGLPIYEIPTATTIEVWMIDLDEPLNQTTSLDKILSIDEQERAERYLSLKNASRFKLCRAMLRLGLARYLEMAPQAITLVMNPHGKPAVEGSPLHFNVSHSGGQGVIAFSGIGEVGVDVEALQRDVEALEIAQANFTGSEAAMVAAAKTPQERTSIFLRLWTRKEAVLKAAGCGLLGGLKTFDVSHGPLNRVRFDHATGSSTECCWRVQDLEEIDGFAGALAAPAGDWTLRQRFVSSREAIEAARELRVC